jgi:hypothetical protein
MRTKLAVLCLAGVALTACTMRATTVAINLGQSAQDFEQVGMGVDGSGFNYWQIIQGACSPSGGNTSCVLSGHYTGATSGFTDGTYSLVTDYVGTGSSPLVGISSTPGGGSFFFFDLGAGTTISLDLHDISGASYAIPIFANGNFTNGYNVFYSSTTTCTGVDAAHCDTVDVAENIGSTIQGPVSGGASFNIADAVAVTPEPTGLALLGLLPGALYACRSRFVEMKSARK